MFQKTKDKILSMNMVENYRRIYPFVHPYRYRAILALTLTIPVGSMDAIIASCLRPFMDTVMIEQNIEQAAYIPLVIILFSFFQSACNYASTYFNNWVGAKITKDLKLTLFSKLLYKDTAYFDKSNSGEVLFRYNNDAEAACAGLLNAVKMFVTRLFSSIALIVVLLWNSWELSIIALTVMAVALYPLTQLRKKIKEMVKDSVFSGGKLMLSFTEAFAGNRIITSYNLQEYEKTRFTGTLEFLFKLSMKLTKRTGILSPLMHFIVSFGIAGVIWLGSYLIINKILTPGEFVSFIAALLMLYTPLKSMGKTFASMQLSFLAMERVFSILDQHNKITCTKDAKILEKIEDSIVYENINFSYSPDKPVLKNFNLEIKVGQNVAFVGNSGGGKTTTANLLPRFYDLLEGSIKIDGVNIKDYDLQSLRSQIAIVFQDNFLFTGTIRDNILLGKTGVSEEEIADVLESACLTEFIDSLEMGLDSQIGERGVLLSGGQKQRIGIARAFMKNAPIVILDEATSALDNKSEAVVQKAINNLMEDRTVIIIAHRLSTIRHADNIVVINHGEIVEQGTHDELMAKENSQYASLYHSSLH